jgi:hypothetical protein
VPLKTNKRIAYLGYAAKLSSRVADGPIFQFQQVGQLGLIQFTDTLFDILEENKIQECLEPVIVAGKNLLPVPVHPLLARDGRQGKGYVGRHVEQIAFLCIDHSPGSRAIGGYSRTGGWTQS